MRDDRTPKKRRGRPVPGRGPIPTNRARDPSNLSDDEIAETLLESEWAREPTPRPRWFKVVKWVCLVGCVIVFPVGLCVLCSWVLWRFPSATIRHRLHGVRVVGKVVAGNEVFALGDDHSYQATVEYTYKGVSYTTLDGPQRRYRWRGGETALVYHIPGSFEPGRYVPPGALTTYTFLLVLLNLTVFGMGLAGAMWLWTALSRGAP
jgi:hypothetical protein